MMKTIIAGSRTVTDFSIVESAITESGFVITEVVSGGAYGVDSLGELWANKNNIPIKKFLADWNFYGKRAGYIRNVEMGNYAQALIAIWMSQSKGTAHMINTALCKGLKVFIKEI